MSNFTKLSELLNTTAGMTVLRNNSGQDDGEDIVTGASWLKYDGAVISSLYVSGNSYIGFGKDATHLQICNRDGKMYYLRRQEGTVGIRKFLKIRWEGYSYWNSTNTQYALKWELFLFDDGGMYLNLIDVPDTSSYLGVSAFTYNGGASKLTIPVAVSTPVAYSLLLENGKFVLSEEAYPGTSSRYVTSGVFEYRTELVQQVTSLFSSKITWDETVPEGTEISVYTKLSNGEYAQCQNGGEIAGLLRGANLTNESLYIKVEMSTTNEYVTPSLSGMRMQILQDNDANVLVLEFADIKDANIRNAVGEVVVQYIGTTVLGAEGPVLGFRKKFVPTDLYMKPNPHVAEHLSLIGTESQYTITQIYPVVIRYPEPGEHLKIMTAADVVSTVTSVNDI